MRRRMRSGTGRKLSTRSPLDSSGCRNGLKTEITIRAEYRRPSSGRPFALLATFGARTIVRKWKKCCARFSANAYANIQYLLYVSKNRQVLVSFGFGATNGLDDIANIRRSLVSLDVRWHR